MAMTDYSFINEYAAQILAEAEAEGLKGPALEMVILSNRVMIENYGKLYIRIPMTFMELFPVGLIISLISAAILKNPKLLPANA